MKFNDQKSLTFNSIKSETQIQPDQELKRHLLSLMKMKLVIKQEYIAEEIMDVKPNDVLIINEDFSSRLLKFKAPLINTKEQQKKENDDITFKTEAD